MSAQPAENALPSVSVLVADAHPLFRLAVSSVIDNHPLMRVAAVCADGAEALRELRRLVPEVALLDVQMPALGGIDVAREVGTGFTQMLVISASDDAASVYQAMAVGVRGYLSKDIEPEALCQAILATSRGETTLSAGMQHRLAGEIHRQTQRPPPMLTPREREVLAMVARGGSTRIIAEALLVSPTTVKSHLDNAYQKLGVSTRAEAATVALRLGLLD